MIIRAYTIQDKDAVLGLLKMNTPQYFAADEEAHLINYLAEDSEHYHVLTIDNIVVACGGINYFPDEYLARISWDIVHPQHQGKGIGKQLTKFRIAEIKNNIAINVIQVRTSQVVYGYYEKMGFVLEKVVKDFWSDGFDLYQMRMDV